MSNYPELARRLTSALELRVDPVSIVFNSSGPDLDRKLDEAPDRPIPAGCSFWEMGAQRTVVTDASDHQNCAIGVHTHNLNVVVPATYQAELRTVLGAMQGLDYVRPEEVEALPVMKTVNQQITYEPLAVANEKPSVVLIFADAAQGLVLSEALSRVDGQLPLAMGRPACALVPWVINNSRSAASLGCCGARAYMDVWTDGVAVWGLASDRLEAYVQEVETLAAANVTLTAFHAGRRQAIESGHSPTVEESLAALESSAQ